MRKIILSLLLFALPAAAQNAFSPTANASSCTVTNTACLILDLTNRANIGSVGVQISGYAAGTFQFEGTVDGTNWTTANAIPLPAGSGPVVTSATGNGQWSMPTGSLRKIRVRVSAADPTGATVTLTPTQEQTTPSRALATTTATAPANTTLTAATATKVFASTAGTCQVACQNIDAAIHVKCGETSAVSATVGLDVPPGAIYKEGPAYGGDVYCFPASGTPAVSCQPTVCQ